MIATPRIDRTRGQGGFSLVELLVSMAVAALLLTGVLAAFNLNSRLARVQTQVADMQQSARISQYDITRVTRMAGRGGLAADIQYLAGTDSMSGPALVVTNNVPANTVIGGAGSPDVVEGTDILTTRGVFSSPIYQVYQDEGTVIPTSDSGAIIVRNLGPTTVPQDLDPVAEAVEAAAAGEPDAIILVSSVGTDYVVVELVGGAVDRGPDGDIISVQLNWSQVGGRAPEYLTLNDINGFPGEMTRVAYVGLLEEYRYYVRADDDGPDRLSRGRFYPGTQVAHASNPTAQEDIADDVIDLQIAYGIDVNDDDLFDIDTEWLWDSDDDDPSDGSWDGRAPYYLRINTLSRTNRPDPKYLDPAIAFIEDRQYNEPTDPPTNEDDRLERAYRRKLLQNVVDLRNLG